MKVKLRKRKEEQKIENLLNLLELMKVRLRKQQEEQNRKI